MYTVVLVPDKEVTSVFNVKAYSSETLAKTDTDGAWYWILNKSNFKEIGLPNNKEREQILMNLFKFAKTTSKKLKKSLNFIEKATDKMKKLPEDLKEYSHKLE